MSNDFDHHDEPKPPLTIDERIDLGRSSGHHYDGAIVPFPPKVRGDAIIAGLRGGERQFIERLQAAGYRITVFEYRSSGGEVIQAILRFDHPTEQKEIRPVRYCGEFDGKGRVFWMTWIEDSKALYGLDRLAARPDAPVLVVEGEKTAEAAAKLFPDHVVITWMSGAYNVRRTEMLALAGRNLVLWPDNDPPGRSAMRTFAAFAYNAGTSSVHFVDVPSEFHVKWDLADPVPAEHVNEYPITELLASARPIDPGAVAHLADDSQQRAEQRRLLGYKPGYTRVELKHTEAALSVLAPDMYGNEWRTVARCIYYAHGDAGLAMFNNWSASGEKYRDGEPGKLWKAFAKESAFRARSLAWLFRKAAARLAERNADESDQPNVALDTDATVTAAIEELSEDHAVVMRGDKLAVLWETYDPRFERYSEAYLSKRDFMDKYMRSITLPDDDGGNERTSRTKARKPKAVKQGKLWFETVQRRQYDGVAFAPGRSLGPKHLNLWRGFTVEPKNDPAGWSRLKEHLLLHVCGGDQASYQYILNWLAFAVQQLDRPIGVALVLIGKKGAGKSIITEILGHLFGQHTFVTSRMDDVIGRFNARLETTALLGLEEAVAPQNRAADGTLKDLVTRPLLRLEGKFFGVWDAPNHLRIVVTSNNEHVVRADGSERRYAVFDVENPNQANPAARRTYFGRMIEQMETGGYSAMLGELLARDIRNWNAEAIPETPALRRQKEMNLVNDPVRAFLFERLSQGDYIVTGSAADGTAIYAWSETEEVAIPARALINEFRAYAQAHGMRFSERQLTTQLPRYMPEGFRSLTVRDPDGISSGTQRVYPFPPLEDARRRFEEVTGLLIDREV